MSLDLIEKKIKFLWNIKFNGTHNKFTYVSILNHKLPKYILLKMDLNFKITIIL